ncbi:hypothetical protein CDL12_02681 [Handroanthus impetiginosus]|uniref:Uncharacterized protein n=1 Tax=Handroanthus impetiginosus TaxID=429701 RepID=A0A2G9I4P1_9LAMI|nr:hypothetical protein CDL12_02681 [Handroanthus impetiginosus]
MGSLPHFKAEKRKGCLKIVLQFDIFKMSMVEVRVPNLDCEGCAGKLRKALFKLKGQYIYLWAFCFLN